MFGVGVVDPFYPGGVVRLEQRRVLGCGGLSQRPLRRQ